MKPARFPTTAHVVIGITILAALLATFVIARGLASAAMIPSEVVTGIVSVTLACLLAGAVTELIRKRLWARQNLVPLLNGSHGPRVASKPAVDDVIKRLATFDELQACLSAYEAVLLIGTFWDRDSADSSVERIYQHRDWFEQHKIRLSQFDLGDVEQAARLFPGLDAYIAVATTEPGLFLVDANQIIKIHFGQLEFDSLLRWIEHP